MVNYQLNIFLLCSYDLIVKINFYEFKKLILIKNILFDFLKN